MVITKELSVLVVCLDHIVSLACLSCFMSSQSDDRGTMSWLRNSPLRASFGKLRPSSYPPKDSDPSACYDSFRKHWQQAMEIIVRTKPPVGYPIQDDVWGVVNHLKHMVTFLVWEHNKQQSHFPCLEHLLSENLLDTLFTWSMHTGRYLQL
uniref:Uncharacterized protein n=1 Tax=Timema poppense TaxID=170557 RepID=A0A7R9DTN2_TIMPO|nr:unnamed protein product [Timema poppensis]